MCEYARTSKSFRFARPPQSATGFGVGMLAVFDHLHAVDENVFHPGRVLVWSIEGRVIGNCFWIEHDDIGEHSFFQHPAMIELEILRRLCAESSNRFR